MCDKAIFQNGGTESVSDCYKNQQMCDKAVDNHSHALNSSLIAVWLRNVW